MDRFVFDDRKENCVNLGEIAELIYNRRLTYKSGQVTTVSEGYGSKIMRALIVFNKDLKKLQETQIICSKD